MHCFANIELRRIVKAPYNLWTDMNVKNNLKWCSNAISYKLFPYDITIGMELFENDRKKTLYDHHWNKCSHKGQETAVCLY